MANLGERLKKLAIGGIFGVLAVWAVPKLLICIWLQAHTPVNTYPRMPQVGCRCGGVPHARGGIGQLAALDDIKNCA